MFYYSRIVQKMQGENAIKKQEKLGLCSFHINATATGNWLKNKKAVMMKRGMFPLAANML
ncbi:hypothetical protein DI43_16505 [Geobacillus sp. CAMR12739]|nr:hypothetical protein DI43_16505 [Geobacillus sp. CAMR12739]